MTLQADQQRIAQEVEALFSDINYWPRGLYFQFILCAVGAKSTDKGWGWT